MTAKILKKKHSKRQHIEASYAPKVRENLMTRFDPDEGQVFVFSESRAGLFYKIDGVAAQVWNRFNGQTTLQEILNDLETEYPATDSLELRRMVTDFVMQLHDASILE